MVGESLLPHQPAMYEAVMKVEPEKPAKPRAAGAAMGRRKMVTSGSFSSTLLTFSVLSGRRAIVIAVVTMRKGDMRKIDRWEIRE